MIASGEAVAAVIADVRSHRVIPVSNAPTSKILGPKWALAGDPVVDVTSIYRSLVADGREFDVYGNSVAPPWKQAALGYQNAYGNVAVIDLFVVEKPVHVWQPGDADDSVNEGDHTIEWDRVEAVINATLWIGGRSAKGTIPTAGPFHMWRIAVYPNGEIADIRWHQLEAIDGRVTDTAITVLLATFNFLNCRNVQLVEPHRPRPLQRRIARYGYQVSELSITPFGRTTRSEPSGNTINLPLHSVRGHFAEYGKNGKGLLFGKYDGRFWIPQHARGSADVGVVAQEFTTVGGP